MTQTSFKKKAVAHLIIKSFVRVGNIRLRCDQLSPRWYPCPIGQFRNVFSRLSPKMTHHTLTLNRLWKFSSTATSLHIILIIKLF
jgi:hypothetical protein